MKLNDFIKMLKNSDRVRIMKGEKELFAGFLAFINGEFDGEDLESIGLTGDEQVNKFRAVPEIRHKRWKELGLMKPLQQDELPEYEFADLMMSLYYTIEIFEI